MARRSTRTDNQAPEQTEAATTEEAPVSTEATETPQESTTTEATSTEETPIDLTAFNESVEAALTDADETTGEVPEAPLAKVKEAYRALDGAKAKNAAKKAVNEAMKEAMNTGAFPKARAYLMISEESLVAGGSSGTSERTPTDPTEAFVQKVATIQLAYGLAVGAVPEGVSDGWQDKVSELVNSSNESAKALLAYVNDTSEDKGDEPESTPVVKNAVKLAQGKAARAGSTRSGGSFDGPRRDIGKHIENAFSDEEEGTFLTIAQIRAKRSDEYGENPPSAGAISARLFPTSGGQSSMLKSGIRPDTQDGKKGAVKDAAAAASDSE